MKGLPDVKWFADTVENVPHGKTFFRICCRFLAGMGKKLTYKQLFMVLYGINKPRIGDEKERWYAINQILKTYKFNNNKLPENVTPND